MSLPLQTIIIQRYIRDYKEVTVRRERTSEDFTFELQKGKPKNKYEDLFLSSIVP